MVKPYSNESKERRNIYAQIGVLYYVVFLTDPQSRLGHQTLEIYRLVDGEYELIPESRVWMPEIGLALGKEKRVHDNRFREWLYWYDETGQRLVVPGESATWWATQQTRSTALPTTFPTVSQF